MKIRAAFWSVVAGAALLLLVRTGDVPLWDPDESRFARTSVEMLRSGNLVVPTFEGEPRLVKPPLLHWIQSFVFSLTGATEWAARLHAAAATLGSILLVGWLGRRRFGPEGGVWAAAALATMPIVLVLGRVGTLDALLAVHVFAAVALDMVDDETGGSFRSFCMGGILGLAFLVKGPIGVFLPLLVMLAGRTAAGQGVLPSVKAVLRAVVAWAVVVLPWGLVFVRRVGLDATWQTIRQEVLERFFAGPTHPEPPWFFGLVGAVAFLPWLAPLLIGIWRAWRLRRDPVAKTAVYAMAGLIAGFVFFSLSQGKVAAYVVPLAPLAAILVTWELGREIEAPHRHTWGPALLSATEAACAVLLGFLGLSRLEGESAVVALAGAAIFAVGALVSGFGVVKRRPRWVYGSAAGSYALFLLAAVLFLYPSLGKTRSTAELIETVPLLSTERPLVTVEVRVPSLTFYLDRIPEIVEMEQLEERLARDDSPIFLFVDVDLPSVPKSVMERLREVGRQGKYVVFEKKGAS